VALITITNKTPQEMKRIKLSPNFNASEVMCSKTGNLIIDEDVIKGMENIRLGLLEPMRIVSGYRSFTPNSKHYKGLAVDFGTVHKSKKLKEVLPLALKFFYRVGIYFWPHGHSKTEGHATIHGDLYMRKGRLGWWHTPDNGYNYITNPEQLVEFITGTLWEDLPI